MDEGILVVPNIQADPSFSAEGKLSSALSPVKFYAGAQIVVMVRYSYWCACIDADIHIHVYVCTHMYVGTDSGDGEIFMLACLHACIYTYTCVCVYAIMFAYVCMYMYKCLHISNLVLYICTCIPLHT